MLLRKTTDDNLYLEITGIHFFVLLVSIKEERLHSFSCGNCSSIVSISHILEAFQAIVHFFLADAIVTSLFNIVELDTCSYGFILPPHEKVKV